MPPGSSWTRRPGPGEAILDRDDLNRIIKALDLAERLSTQDPLEVTPPGLSGGRTLTAELDPGLPPTTTTMNVRLTGFQAGTGRYAWTEVYLDNTTGTFLDTPSGKTGSFEADWAIEINGVADCWDPTPGVKSFARIIPSEGFGFYRFYQIKKGALEDPCASRTLTSRVRWGDTGKACNSVTSHVITKQGSGEVVPTTFFSTGAVSADLSPETLGPGAYTIQIQVNNNGRVCALESEVVIAIGDCDVTVDTPVCCPRIQIRTFGCGGYNFEQGDGQVTFDRLPDTVAVSIQGTTIADPDVLTPYPTGTIEAALVANAPFDSTPTSGSTEFTCGGPDDFGFGDGTMKFTMNPSPPDSSHVCGCQAPPYPRTLHYSDSDGNTAVLTWSDLCGRWMGTYVVTGKFVHTTSPGIEHQCVEPEVEASTAVLVSLSCGGSWGSAWRLTKNYYSCVRQVDQGPPGPYGTFLFDVTSIGGVEWEIDIAAQCPGDQGSDAWGDDATPVGDEFPASLNFTIHDNCGGCMSSIIGKVYNVCVITV